MVSVTEIEDAAEEREPSHRADPVEFGIDVELVRPRFARYVDRAVHWTSHESGEN